ITKSSPRRFVDRSPEVPYYRCPGTKGIPEGKPMRYVAGRLLQSVLTLFIFMVVIFVATRAAGDPATLLMPPDAGPEDIAAARKRFGTDKPYSDQFLIFLEDLVTFDLGRSVVHKEPVG